MATSLMPSNEFWTDGSVWIAEPERSVEGQSLADFARNELRVRDCCFFQTSGSEGKRKWVGLTKEALRVSAGAVNAHFGITGRDHWLLALPTHHVGGFGVLARADLSGSQVTRLEGKWSAAAFATLCEESGATVASLVPTQVFDLVSARLAAPQTLRVILVGGGAMSAELEEAALQLGWPVRRTYGMTETASQVATQTKDRGELEVLPIWTLRTDAEGTLTVRGEALAKGYAIHEGETWRWEPIPPATGLRTRDRVSVWHEGGQPFLRFVGREANTIKILGELVSLGPIQERLEALRLELDLPSGEAVICDVPDARKEARLVLVVSAMDDAEAGRLQKGLNATLRPFETVDEIRHVDRIPRSELGKVLLESLRRQL
ncbi:MAG: AMP-binding protein [Prosthecobacter sp.]|jgi:O-succinylbenzoic acid--CoA ligase|uniref:AMP-binding protein n=1 Tax=Prosthecobacter sp. TaxID=1965333 RepID=UPI0019F172A9|nr:AMP-binding protein [Prosthecobacter sp.]MBE2282496.1 AMP-binding protein [Prosthecobacter sp.]